MIRRGLIALLLLFSLPAQADEALTMYGPPREKAGFTHLDYVNPAAPKGGTLRLSKSGSFDNLNNHIILGNNAEGLELVNDKLMQRAWNEPFTMYGLVAQSVDLSPDRSTITFHLNRNARFHDGVPMTAEDVKWTYEFYRAKGHPVRRRVYGLVTDVKILSPHDIRFTFGKGYDRESVMILAMMPVLPKHYWEKHDLSKTTLVPPLGSGPYRIREVVPGRRVVYERVKDYWAKDLPINAGQYNFDTIVYTYYRDEDISLQAFKSGDYDVRQEYNIQKWMTAYESRALREGRAVKEELAYQRPDILRAMIFNTRRAPFNDRRVREALNLLYDFNWINKNLYFNALKRITSLYPNSELAATGLPQGEERAALAPYKNDLPPEVFGPAWQPSAAPQRERERKAVALLKEAGWTYKEGVLVEAQSGAPFSFEILLGDPADEKVALSFSRSLRKLGIDARVRTVDSAQFVGRLDDYDYDMVVHRWINSLSPGNEQLNYWGTAAAKNKGARNYAGIESPAIDALAGGIAHAASREDLVARTRALDRAVMWGYYMIPLHYLGRDLVARSTGIERPDVTPLYGISKESWWARPAK